MRVLLALIIGLVVVAGCGGDDDGGGTAGSSSACPSDAVTIKMADIKFNPETTTVEAGQQVCWVNEDSVQHDAVAESGADFKSELFNKGETFTTTVDQPGTVKYVCTVHPGMTGTLEVK
ncbi:MAG TPA: plastocyanin/azurin family copper-binding protein [Solirubrobacteraceae bacterium]|nr:plastocyanin/azurin family copper-binding protein [Solirubrobacteraceae bacterium]